MAAVFCRRRLPHYDPPAATYFVTACLAGSIPALGSLRIGRERKAVASLSRPATVSAEQWRLQCQQRVFDTQEDWLDCRPAVQWLKNPCLAAVVAEEMKRLARSWLDLHAYVVMPSHVHLVFTPRDDWVRTLAAESVVSATPRSLIVRSLKGVSARLCNRLLKRRGTFWQTESYDRVVRHAMDLERIVDYVHYNPVKAGLCERPEEWEFSSAHVKPCARASRRV